MRIAISSQNFRSISAHAGKTRRFLIYDLLPDAAPTEVERLDLPKEMSLHEYHGDDHPLYRLGLDAIVTGGAGEHFIGRMARQGIRVIATGETDIPTVLAALTAGTALPPAAPHVDGDPHHHGQHGHRH
ncbi:MAG: nitrogen fixation protein [Chromatiaceae bacterium]|nr:MAG: nitrogen fixation protein [Chromatiaceae bacterium]